MSYRRLITLVSNLSPQSIFLLQVDKYNKEKKKEEINEMDIKPQDVMRMF